MDSGGKMEGGRGITSSNMNQHKRMAGAERSDDFGVCKWPASAGDHPDVGMKHEAMSDGSRGAGPGMGSGMAKQAAPDHGPSGRDHFTRDGKA